MNTPELPETFGMTVDVAVRWSDGDVQGVVNNAVYMTLFEEARHAYCAKLQLLEGTHFPFLLAQTNVLFKAPGECGSRLNVEIATTHLGQSSFTQSYRVSTQADVPQVLCEAQARLVCYDGTSGQSRPMTTAFRAALVDFEGDRINPR